MSTPEGNIVSAMLSYAPIASLVSNQIGFPYASDSWSGEYIVIQEISSAVSDMPIVNDDILQIDIYVDRDNYHISKQIRKHIKEFFRTQIIDGVLLYYQGSTTSVQESPDKFRRIMQYRCLNKL